MQLRLRAVEAADRKASNEDEEGGKMGINGSSMLAGPTSTTSTHWQTWRCDDSAITNFIGH